MYIERKIKIERVDIMSKWLKGRHVEVRNNIVHEGEKVVVTNLQNVKEYLMRKAVKHTEVYCTDIIGTLYNLESKILELLEKGKSSFKIGMGESNIDEDYSCLWKGEEEYHYIYEIILEKENEGTVWVNVIKK